MLWARRIEKQLLVMMASQQALDDLRTCSQALSMAYGQGTYDADNHVTNRCQTLGGHAPGTKSRKEKHDTPCSVVLDYHCQQPVMPAACDLRPAHQAGLEQPPQVTHC